MLLHIPESPGTDNNSVHDSGFVPAWHVPLRAAPTAKGKKKEPTPTAVFEAKTQACEFAFSYHHILEPETELPASSVVVLPKLIRPFGFLS